MHSSLRIPSLVSWAAFLLAACLAFAACTPAASPTPSPTAPSTSVPSPIAMGTPPATYGWQVGQRAPEFSVTTLDGKTVTYSDIYGRGTSASGRPVMLFFFATWCGTCRSELRELREIAPTFEDKLDLVLVSIDPSEPARDLMTFQQSNGYPGTVVRANEKFLKDYNVLIRSTKIGIDREEGIVFRSGYGEVPKGTWEATVKALTG